VQGAAAVPDADVGRQRAVVDAFLAAARGGDFEALLAVLGGCSPAAKTHAPAAFISWFKASTSRITFARASGGGGSPSGM
jgi:RNA polymerase sigma-70 factor (ECF subfamily)